MKGSPGARITRVHNSFRVRLYGYPPAFFSPSEYGGEEAALEAARRWRDERWDGRRRTRSGKPALTPEQVREIQESSEYYRDVAKRFGISTNHVHYLRRKRKR